LDLESSIWDAQLTIRLQEMVESGMSLPPYTVPFKLQKTRHQMTSSDAGPGTVRSLNFPVHWSPSTPRPVLLSDDNAAWLVFIERDGTQVPTQWLSSHGISARSRRYWRQETKTCVLTVCGTAIFRPRGRTSRLRSLIATGAQRCLAIGSSIFHIRGNPPLARLPRLRI
jgi:hypothetical protein